MVKKNARGLYGHGMQLSEEQEQRLNALRDKHSIPEILMAGCDALLATGKEED